MALQQHRSRDPIDALTASAALDAAREEGALCSYGCQPLIDKLHRQARLAANRTGKLPRGDRLRTVRAIEAQGQADDDAFNFMAAGNLRQPGGETLPRLGRHRRQRLGDGLGGVAESQADSL